MEGASFTDKRPIWLTCAVNAAFGIVTPENVFIILYQSIYLFVEGVGKEFLSSLYVANLLSSPGLFLTHILGLR